ncbi:MAG: hypothetical protein E7H74_18610 [Escherichia coli]|nr:hypothetical protein [Escherichia coli]QVV96898.1 hypothetical protein [Kosakonia phage Kc259]
MSAPNPTGKGGFSAARQPAKRTPRGKSKRTELLAAIEKLQIEDPETGKKIALTERKIYQLVIQKAMYEPSLWKLILDRLHPLTRPQMEKVHFVFTEGATLAEKMDEVIKAVAAGEVTPDGGKMLADMLTGAARIAEISDLEARITELERSRGRDSTGSTPPPRRHLRAVGSDTDEA